MALTSDGGITGETSCSPFERAITQNLHFHRALVKNHNARWRMLMVFLMGFFGQMSGNGLGYFNVRNNFDLRVGLPDILSFG